MEQPYIVLLYLVAPTCEAGVLNFVSGGTFWGLGFVFSLAVGECGSLIPA